MSNGTANVKDPKITVLMSVYNGEKYLREAIDSILNQTFMDFEFLIINDGSIDKTADILQSYTDPRIRIVNNEENMGLTKSLNRGLKIARGRYIARMDADDISYPRRLEVQYEYMEKNPDVGIVDNWVNIIDSEGNVTSSLKWNCSSEDIYYTLNFRNCLVHGSTFLRKDLVMDNGGYNETIKVSQDFELWNRISKVAKIHKIQETLIKRRVTSDSIGHRMKSKQLETRRNVVRNNFERLINGKIDERIVDFIRDNFNHPNVHYLAILTRYELLYSIKLIDKISKRIVNDAPSSLNKENLRKIAENKLINYIRIISLKVSILDSARCVNKYVNGKWVRAKGYRDLLNIFLCTMILKRLFPDYLNEKRMKIVITHSALLEDGLKKTVNFWKAKLSEH